ncbi:MAG: tyrosine-protein phosphatase [Pseudochelatococcus sp.]|jgi:protein-tyrosine phosphatase|uniref:tyrosine-protein phosphatase n=1 Tax=Pseudochelatococcus sp. TaxID=2020869 RepID=UPI003D8E1658
MNTVAPTRQIPLAGAHNLRDLGGYPTGRGGATAWRRLLRSDGLHALTEQDVDRLRGIGLRTVIDLRSQQEAAYQPGRLVDEPGFTCLRIPLFSALAPINMAMAAQDFDLGQRYLDAIAQCGAAIAGVLTAIAEADDAPLLFHCTAGKDRTGLIAAFLLGMVGVGDDAIVADYTLTSTLAEPLLRRLRETAAARGRRPEHVAALLSTPPDAMQRVLDRIRDEHGGIDGYIARIGVGPALRERLRRRLSGPAE